MLFFLSLSISLALLPDHNGIVLRPSGPKRWRRDRERNASGIPRRQGLVGALSLFLSFFFLFFPRSVRRRAGALGRGSGGELVARQEQGRGGGNIPRTDELSLLDGEDGRADKGGRG